MKPRRRADLKTYAHLAGARRMPSEYELVTSELLYYPKKGGFEVRTPLSEWYERYQRRSALVCDDWESFVDPRETTYVKYTQIQRAQEAHVDALLDEIERSGLSAHLEPAGVGLLERTLPVLRYPIHGLMMVAAYVGQMAPSGRIVACAALQAGDEVRRVQRISQRMALFGRDFGKGAKAAWQDAGPWQPLREVVERALVAWDWGEALVALNLCIKPLFDEMLRTRLADAALAAGDHLLAPILASLARDCEWHQRWALAACNVAVDRRPELRSVVDGWVSMWRPRAARAIEALAPLLAEPALAEHVGVP